MTGFAIPPEPDFASYSTTAQMVAAIQAATSTVPRFVSDPIAAPLTIDTLHADYPPNATQRGKYARVTDYAGTIDRVLRCDFDSLSGLYFWGPSGSDQSFRSMALTGDMTLAPLKSPAIVQLTGSVPTLTTRTVNLTTTYGRPGDVKTIKAGLSSLLGTLNIAGTGLGSVVSLALGATATFGCEWDSGTSALRWVRLT